MKPTPEQEEIISHVASTTDNLVINALAGTGKTTTLQMVQTVSKDQPIIYLAFNKRVAEEACEKFDSTTTVRTLNALGHRIWMKVAKGKVVVDPKKTQTILRSLIEEFPKDVRSEIWDVFWEICDAVAKAKALGYVPEGKYPHAKRLISKEAFHASLDETPDEITCELIDAVLTLSIRTAYEGNIDYNDQLYMPALFGGTFPQYPLVMGDEVQDFSPINHALLDKLVRKRLIAVGDPWQSIYAFRGAKQRGMEELTAKFKAKTCNLSVSFRCPQAIVEAARRPGFKWLKPGGHYEILKTLKISEIPEGAAIICRNNSPLFRLAMRMLSAKRPVSVAGSDIGPKITGILKRLGEDGMSRNGVISAINNWREEKLAKGSATAQDIADCMLVFASFGSTLGQAVAVAEHLFKQSGSIRLITGHKSKGLEWDVVYHLDPGLIRMGEQETNLRYVITTRSKRELYEINSEQIGE